MSHDGIGRCQPRLWALDRHTALLATERGDAKTAGHAFVRGAEPSDGCTCRCITERTEPNCVGRLTLRSATGCIALVRLVAVNCIGWLKTGRLPWGTNWNLCLSFIRTSPNETSVSEVDSRPVWGLYWDRFFSEHYCVPLLGSLYQRCALVCILIRLA